MSADPPPSSSDQIAPRRRLLPRPPYKKRTTNARGRYECQVCGKDFSTTYGLSGHYKVHVRERRDAKNEIAASADSSTSLPPPDDAPASGSTSSGSGEPDLVPESEPVNEDGFKDLDLNHPLPPKYFRYGVTKSNPFD